MAKANHQSASPAKQAKPAHPVNPANTAKQGSAAAPGQKAMSAFPRLSSKNLPVRLGEIEGVNMPVVSARDLYACLGLVRDFSAWLKILQFKPHVAADRKLSHL